MTTDSTPEEKSARAVDRKYFRHLEDLFIALRGAPLLLSPADWETARAWRTDGIPIDLIERVLREIFERVAEKGGRKSVRSLKYFDRPVRQAWDEVREMTAAEREFERSAAPLDLPGRLEALALGIPDEPSALRDIARQVRDLHGTPETVESELSALDQSMLVSAENSLQAEEVDSLDQTVESALKRLDHRIGEQERDAIAARLRTRHLRRLRDLPHLSLFSLDALKADT